MIQIERHAQGPRIYILGCRIHHGLLGLALAAVGILLAWNDRADIPWLHDR